MTTHGYNLDIVLICCENFNCLAIMVHEKKRDDRRVDGQRTVVMAFFYF